MALFKGALVLPVVVGGPLEAVDDVAVDEDVEVITSGTCEEMQGRVCGGWKWVVEGGG